jgi:ADP-heptose:LPS heptosyltransferase
VKVLVIRFSSIGDIILTSPIPRLLKGQLGDEVHFLTKESFAFLLKHNPNINRVWNSSPEVIPQLKKEAFDVVIDLHHNVRSRKVVTALKTASYAVNKENYKKWLMVNFKTPYSLNHIVDRYINTYPPLRPDGLGLNYYPAPDTQHPAIDKHYPVVVGIGGQHATKRMPTSKWKKLIAGLNTPVAIVGGPEDTENAAQLEGPNATSFAGKISLDQTALLVSTASSVITHDTAVLHMAAAYNKPTFSIWGNTVPEFGMTPYFPNGSEAEHRSQQFLVRTGCQPCSKIGHKVCPLGHFKCMNDQPVEEIALSVNQVVAMDEA